MIIEIVQQNEEGFEHYILIPTIQIVNEFDGQQWENSIGISFLNYSIWMVW